MRVVIEKVLPGERIARGVDNAEGVCSRLAMGVARVSRGAGDESPGEVFERLGGA
ncbi:MAG: hypothetical protein ACPGVZ_04985 [Myxococcota bacterium]